jgi:hypothetical protein
MRRPKADRFESASAAAKPSSSQPVAATTPKNRTRIGPHFRRKKAQ